MSENQAENPEPHLTRNPHGHEDTIGKLINKGSTEQQARNQVAASLKNPVTRDLVREGRRNVEVESKRTAEQAELATTDTLTGLYNRRWMELELPKIIAASEREGVPLSVLVLDLDKFKTINDTLGHKRGDIVLKEVADMMRGVFSRPSDRAVRTGGDEFVLVLEGTPAQTFDEYGNVVGGAIVPATELIGKFNSHEWNFPPGTDPNLIPGVSIGIAQHRRGDHQTLINNADQAMYTAKEAGRGRVVIWSPGLSTAPPQ